MTPDRPIRLAGYASRPEPISTILDPLEISAVLLEDGVHRCLIFSFDLMIVGSELQKLIFDRLAGHGFAAHEIVLLASHTHFAPATDLACARLGQPDERYVRELADAAEGLLLKMLREQPCEVALEFLRGELDHSVNRRRYWPFPTLNRAYGLRMTSISMAPDPKGKTDPHATILLLRKSGSAELTAVVWHYACHPTAAAPIDIISADYPGRVRTALRERFGQIPCVFVQGFCGDIIPKRRRIRPKADARDIIRRIVWKIVSGPTFPASSPEEWRRWSGDLAAKIIDIAVGAPGKVASPASLAAGSASISLAEFFTGAVPDKPLTAQVVRLGDTIELVALSAEAVVEWQEIIDREIPVQNGRLRLYAGYLGALFGYLPTPLQIRQGGYEVDGFQPLFGLAGHFEPDRIIPAVVGCVRRAFSDLEQRG